LYELVERPDVGRKSGVDGARSGRHTEQIDQRIRDNRRISFNQIASEIRITHGKKRFRNGL